MKNQKILYWIVTGLTAAFMLPASIPDVDLMGALYSHLSVGDALSAWIPAAIGLVLVSGSYLSYRRSHVHVSASVEGVRTMGIRRGVDRGEPGNIAWGN